MIKNINLWLEGYLKNSIATLLNGKKSETYQILFTICDHFEPFWGNCDLQVAHRRVQKWVDKYQEIASNHKDSYGNHPKHGFYYPIEEYQKELLDMVGGICRNGYGETEVHLHHDNDTSENLRKTLIDFKKKLYEEHGLLSSDQASGQIRYGFIHGNWALDNSRPDGKWCGVNDEISILQETGCYADFTMPSAPSDTQTRTVNSIYYAEDDPLQPKSHDTGKLAIAGFENNIGLMCIQGPLSFNIYSRKFGIIPRIENGNLSYDMGIYPGRIKTWVNQRIHVKGRPDIIFIKLYTHGTQEKNMDFFFKQKGLSQLFSCLEEYCQKHPNYFLNYVSSRQMYNVVKGLENNPESNIENLKEFDLKLQY